MLLSRLSFRQFCTKPFESYFGELALLRGLADGSIVRGELAVSHHNNTRARVITGVSPGISCAGFVNRNRALSGDSVYASVDDGRVVGIEKRVDQRFVVRVKPKEEFVQPRDVRFPAMRLERSLDDMHVPTLALVKFKEWCETEMQPDCGLVRVLGEEGSFDAEDDACVEMAGLVSDPHLHETTVHTPKTSGRRDCRSERVFTIDPPSARDLDDAISVVRCADGTVRVGVHVADVGEFVRPDTALDAEARRRATSVYLARRVYPMLPASLSEDACSLLPNVDRLAFSVYFSLDENTAELVGEAEFVRTVIRSCAQLSYDQADSGEVPNSGVRADIALLTRLTSEIRKRRIANGAITISDRTGEELKFEFLQNFPIAITTHKSVADTITTHKSVADTSHQLIEELMVLTNSLVAEKLAAHSDAPILRRHADSSAAVLNAGNDFLVRAGLECELTDVQSMLAFANRNLSPALLSRFTNSVLSEFNRAEYFTGSETASAFHWGVGANKYMHFTSPIRRYADLLVHRELAKIVGMVAAENHQQSACTAAAQEHEQSACTGEPDEHEQILRCNRHTQLAAEAEKANKLFYFGVFVKAFANAGFPIEAVVNELIGPDPDRGIKGSLSLYVPAIGEIRSQSLESLGLEFMSLHEGRLKVKHTHETMHYEIKPLAVVRVRAVVRNGVKFHFRMDSVPPPPSVPHPLD